MRKTFLDKDASHLLMLGASLQSGINDNSKDRTSMQSLKDASAVFKMRIKSGQIEDHLLLQTRALAGKAASSTRARSVKNKPDQNWEAHALDAWKTMETKLEASPASLKKVRSDASLNKLATLPQTIVFQVEEMANRKKVTSSKKGDAIKKLETLLEQKAKTIKAPFVTLGNDDQRIVSHRPSTSKQN